MLMGRRRETEDSYSDEVKGVFFVRFVRQNLSSSACIVQGVPNKVDSSQNSDYFLADF